MSFRDDRKKNEQALADLEIVSCKRAEIIQSLKVEDYSSGPDTDTLNFLMPLWVFGKDVKHHEIYIKVSLGKSDKSAVCVSFHVAEHPLEHPFKH